MGHGPEADLCAEFSSRLRPALEVREIAPALGSPGEIRKQEGEALLAAIGPRDVLVALDSGGKTITSEGFAALLQSWADSGRKPAFVIGGAEGLSRDVITRAAHVLSLGVMTWPHRLVRVMLAEQLFRAQCIASGHPYHRAGRP